MTELISKTGERIIPEKFESIEDYLIYLRHLFAYEFTSKTLSKDSTVLEVGCGEGYGTSFLSKSVKKIVGLEVDEQIVKHSQKKYISPNCSFQLYCGEEIPFKDNTFDTVISFQVIEHIQDDKNYISEIYRALKKNGIFILTTPNKTYRLKPDQKPWNKFHIREYYPHELKNLLKTVFQNIKMHGIRGNKEIEKIEINRVRPNLSPFFRLLQIKKALLKFVKNEIIKSNAKSLCKDSNFLGRYSTKDFYVTQEHVEKSLDIFAVCKK